MSNFKKFTFIVVTALFVVGSLGLTGAPRASQAAVAGDLIKMAGNSAVYYYDGTKRYVFPNESTYKSWYADFSGVVTVSQTELQNIDFGGNVTMRPGTWMVKVTTIPKVYAVEPGGVLRWIDSEARAVALYGSNWNTMIKDVSDAFWVNYTTGTTVTTDKHTTGTLIKYANNATVYYIDANGMKRAIASEAAMAANMFRSEFIRTTTISYSDGSSITGKEAALTNVAGSSSTATITGDVSVMLDPATPASATVPLGATSVPFLKFKVTNGNSTAVTLTNLTVHRSGAGATADFNNVYLFQGSTRLTSGRSINSSSNDAIFTGLSLSIPAGGSVTLDVLADICTTAGSLCSANAGSGDVHVLSVTSATVSGVTASGTAAGNAMTIAGVDVGSMTIAKNGTLSNPKVAEKVVEIAQFQLTAGSVEDVELTRLILTNVGNISRDNLTNLMLKDRATGNLLSSSASLNSKDQVVFDLATPLLFEKGNAKTLSVYADIGNSAKANDTIRIYLENTADLYAKGKTYGYGARVASGSYDNGANDGTDASWTTVQAGQLTITLNGPAAKDIAKNGKDVEILNFNMTAQSELEVRNFSLIMNNGGSGTANFNDGTTTNFTDLKIWDVASNTVVWGPTDLSGTGSATSQDILFTEDVNLPAGSSRAYKVTVDVANTSDIADGDVIAATIDVSDFANQVKNLGNNSFLATTDIVPGSDVAGNQMTLRIPALTITLATTPTSQSYIKGSTAKNFVGFNFTAGTGADIKVTSVMTTCYIDDSNVQTDFVKGQDTDAGGGTTACQDDVPSVRLKVDGTQIGDTKSPAATTDGTSTFTNLNLTIPAGTTKVVMVEGDISQSAYRNSNVERISFDLADVSADISASDPSGNTVTATGDAANGGTSPNRIVTINDAGTLTVDAITNETGVTDARIIAAGTAGVTLSKFKFTAAGEELKVTKARFALTSIDAEADVSDAVVSVSLYDGATKVAGPVYPTPVSSSTIDANVDFNSFTTNFVVPKDGTKTLTVKADLNTISGGADSGDEFSLDLDMDTSFEARGTSGSTVVTSSGSGNEAGSDVVIRKSMPKIELVTLPTTTLSNGTVTLLRFKVTAMDDDVALKHFTFSTANSDGAGVTVASQAIREVGSTTDITATSSISGTTTITTDITFDSEQVLTAGTSKTLDFRGSVTGAGSGDNLATYIPGDTAIVTGDLGTLAAAEQIDDLDGTNDIGDDTDAADAAYNFIWSDMSAVPHNDTADGTDDWTNGRYVKTVATDTQTVTFPQS